MESCERSNFLHSVISLNLYPEKGWSKNICISQGRLHDLILVGQDTNLIQEFYEFPIFPGIGTGRYSKGIEKDLGALFRGGGIFGNWIYTPVVLLKKPENFDSRAKGLEKVKEVCESAEFLSYVAAYFQARRAEKQEEVSLDDSELNKRAISRLGWDKIRFRGKNLQRVLEEARRDLFVED